VARRAQGRPRGDRLANCRELLEVYWAVPSIGAVLVPLSPLLMASGLASLLRDSGAVCLITQRSMAPMLDQVRDELPDLRCRPRADGRRSDSRLPRLRGAAQDLSGRRQRAGAGRPGRYVQHHVYQRHDRPAERNHAQPFRALDVLHLFASAWRMTSESVVLHTGAIVFNGAFVTLMPCFYLGARYVLQRQFDAEEAIEIIARERVTHTMMVPAQIIAVLNAPNFSPEKLASLEMILSLGAPLYQEYKDLLNRLLARPLLRTLRPHRRFLDHPRQDAVAAQGRFGRVAARFYEMRIVREDGSDAPAGEVGEIVGRGPSLMLGYYGRPDLTEQAIRDGWLFTGDLGYADGEGYLYLVDRKKDMIDSGGVKVYPKDVEEVAARHPAVREVAVFGVAHEKWGETPVAAVVLRAAPRSPPANCATGSTNASAPATSACTRCRSWTTSRATPPARR
jgi:long-chain acyl-CoA synthetase